MPKVFHLTEVPMNSLRIHWSLPIDGEKARASQMTRSGIPDLPAMAEFCRTAERCGIDSLLTPFGFHMPDPVPLVGALALQSSTIKFLIAYRPGLISPTLFVQQINTLSQLAQGRVTFNVIAGTSPAEQAYYGDFADHDQRYERAAEFIQICRALWEQRTGVTFTGRHYRIENATLNTPFFGEGRPEIYVSGNSDISRQTARQWGDCWLRYADAPHALAQDGVPFGLRLSVVARPTREEAVRAAYDIVARPDLNWKEFIRHLIEKSDSVAVKSTYALAQTHQEGWLTPTLWMGAVAFRGGPAVAIVGDPHDVAQTLMDFKQAGVSQVILSGWPNLAEMAFFGEAVLPELRKLEEQDRVRTGHDESGVAADLCAVRAETEASVVRAD
jgi:alkanesulfonate monooxygenase